MNSAGMAKKLYWKNSNEKLGFPPKIDTMSHGTARIKLLLYKKGRKPASPNKTNQ
jgi:hypothetical protein